MERRDETGGLADLVRYMISVAKQDIADGKLLLENNSLLSANNRIYYAMFHAMRAITVLDGFDASKHSSIIACFNKDYVKTGVFDKKASKIVKSASVLREKSDYEDFYIASKTDAETQVKNAEEFLAMVELYLKEKGII